MINQQCVKELKRRVSIVDTVSESVSLRETPSGQYRGLSPFSPKGHLIVDPDCQQFHCVATETTGDVIDWIMRTERSNFREAVHKIAKTAGFRLHYKRKRSNAARRPKDRSASWTKDGSRQ